VKTLLALGLAGLVALPGASPARLGVTAKEFRLTLSRQTVTHGRVVIELDNFGEDVHDLKLRRVGGWRTYSLPQTKPGRRSELDARLAPGRYRLWCSIADHAKRGMRATLVVR
jgi:hypothetical protein